MPTPSGPRAPEASERRTANDLRDLLWLPFPLCDGGSARLIWSVLAPRFEKMEQQKSLSEKSWVAIWRVAGRELEMIRHREIKRVDTRMAILSLADAFESARLHHRLAASSGMIEMERLFGQVSDGAVDQDCR